MNTVKIEVNSLPTKAVNYLVELLELKRVEYKSEPVKKWYLNSILDLSQAPHDFAEDWLFGGEIIQREKLHFRQEKEGQFLGFKWDGNVHLQLSEGMSELDASMKAYITHELGGFVEVPEALLDESKPSPKI